MSTYNVPLVAKIMAKDNPFFMVAMVNLEFLSDVNLFNSLSCLMFMLKIVHGLIKFA